MKLIILILIVLAGLPSESYRLPALNVRVKIDPLFLAKFVKAITSLLVMMLFSSSMAAKAVSYS